MGAKSKKTLAPVCPANTSVTDLVSNATGRRTILQSLQISNSSASDRTARLFYDPLGATFTTATQIGYEIRIPANETIQMQWGAGPGTGFYLEEATAKIKCRSSNANDLTFTASVEIEAT